MIGRQLSLGSLPILSEYSPAALVGLAVIFAFASALIYLVGSEIQRQHARIPKINGPTGLPIVGNLFQLGPDPAERLHQWGKRFGGIYQIMMGERPVIVFNSLQAARDVFIGQGGSLVDRPSFYTFHNVLSSKASSIGTTGWTDSNKRRRKAAASAMNKPNTASYAPFIDELTTSLIAELLEKGDAGREAFDPKTSIQHAILDLGMTVNYGTRLPPEESLFDEINFVEDNVSRFRSTTGALQDYIPIMRLMPMNAKSAHARQINSRRLEYLERFNRELKDRIDSGTDMPCIQGNCLKDPEAKLSELELLSISMSMIGGGLDTMVNTTMWTIGTLARRPDIQDAAYRAICEVHGSQNWGDAGQDNAIPYIDALVKEALRWSSVFRMSLPRQAWKDIQYGDVFIPQGTTIFLNVWGCNRDEQLYGPDANEFRPERFLEETDLPHATYGFGTRMCAGVHLANRQLYLLLLRLVWSFRFELSEDASQNDWSVRPLEDLTEPFHFAAIPPRFSLRLVPRDRAALDSVLA